ncbi:MAG: tRNA (adenosine(37)-N6)-dimethylallyltransferase MiaA [Myxococcales bacterium]|nr:tRNA (adenosine(37)-N6)-dimethylallyltransferase MiaA [Myxococcales bacterium]
MTPAARASDVDTALARRFAPAVEAGELLVVVGPTGSGKTELAIRLARALGGEVVGADSVQIYRGFDRGSGKPSAAERALAPHHLVDVADPLEPFDAARFAALAAAAIADIGGRGRVPVVCGGTFLWVKALLYGLAPTPPASPELRARHALLAAERGRAYLHDALRAVDPESADRLAPNDLVRVSRALEIHELTGRPQSLWHAEHGFARPRYRARLVGIERARPELDRRLVERTARWLAAGWVAEVRALLPHYADARAMASVGYRQVRAHLDGELAEADLAAAIVRATRVFVRRQRTWLREAPVTWLAPADAGEAERPD